MQITHNSTWKSSKKKDAKSIREKNQNTVEKVEKVEIKDTIKNGVISHGKKVYTEELTHQDSNIVQTSDDDTSFVVHKKIHTKKENNNHISTQNNNIPKVQTPPTLKPSKKIMLENAPKVSLKTIETLNEEFNNDISVILGDIISGTTNFEEYNIDVFIENFDIIEGDEGIAHKTETHNFTLRTPTPNAIKYLVFTLLEASYQMGYDKNKLTNMLIDIISMATSINDWLTMLPSLWKELVRQRRL